MPPNKRLKLKRDSLGSCVTLPQAPFSTLNLSPTLAHEFVRASGSKPSRTVSTRQEERLV